MKELLKFYTTLNLFFFRAAQKFRKNYQPLPALGIEASAKREERHKVRLKAIRDHIEGVCSILEIGCNMGFYALALAQDGHFVTGIDSKANVLFLTHIKNKLEISNIALSNMWLSPENVGLLPHHDVILCMSVMQHWCREYGEVEAFDLLKVLCGKCRLLFFDMTECSNTSMKYNEKFSRILPDMGDDPEEWLRNWFISNTQCERVETIAYVRGRHLFKIEFKKEKVFRNKPGLKIVHSISGRRN
jgi:SAM-dependent methyltransferase